MKSIKDYKIVYMGTPEMSAKILECLIQDGFNIIALIAQEDKPKGRRGDLQKVPTKVVAEKYNIPVYQPHRIRKEYEFIQDLKPDLILTMAYGQIVPQGLLDIPKRGCLNIHGSLLPKLRGAAPIQRAIINGETKTGVTLMEMVDKMDAGKIYALEECDIEPDETYSHLCKKIVDCAIKVIRENLYSYLEGDLEGIEQDENFVSYAEKIKPEDEKLDLSKPTKLFLNWIRGLSEEPGGYVYLNSFKFKIFQAHQISEEVHHEVGYLTLGKQAILQLSDGEIELDEVQLEGRKKMDARSFANGARQLNGTILK